MHPNQFGMAGYWTDHYCGSGRRTVTFYYPSWWERLLEYVLHDRTWTAYPKLTDGSGDAER